MKKTVFRLDIVSHNLYPTDEMIRVVRNNEGQVFIQLSKRLAGRGAYIYPQVDALQKIKKYHLLEKALKVNISEDIYQELEQIINEEVKKHGE